MMSSSSRQHSREPRHVQTVSEPSVHCDLATWLCCQIALSSTGLSLTIRVAAERTIPCELTVFENVQYKKLQNDHRLHVLVKGLASFE